MRSALASVKDAHAALVEVFARQDEAVVGRGLLHPATSQERPVFVSVSLHGLERAEGDATSGLSLLQAVLMLTIQCRENDREEEQLYDDYFAPAVERLEQLGWEFGDSTLMLPEVGKVRMQTIAAELRRVPD